MMRPSIVALSLAVGLLCSCGKPLPPGAYTVVTKELKHNGDTVARQYLIETASLRRLCLQSESGEDSSSIAPDVMTKEHTHKAEATLTITKQGTGVEAQQAVLEMTVKSGNITGRFKRDLPVPAKTNLTALLSEIRMDGGQPMTNKTTLLRLASGSRWLEVSVE